VDQIKNQANGSKGPIVKAINHEENGSQKGVKCKQNNGEVKFCYLPVEFDNHQVVSTKSKKRNLVEHLHSNPVHFQQNSWTFECMGEPSIWPEHLFT
jgi:hypothetical protein